MSASKKSYSFEIELLPMISVLAVCVCFLLLTAVWIAVGTVDTTQAIGAESTAGGENPPSLVVQMDPSQSVQFQLKDVPKAGKRDFVVAARGGEADWNRVDEFLASLRSRYPEIKTSVVLTRPNVTYGVIIKMVDSLKKAEIGQVGISPM